MPAVTLKTLHHYLKLLENGSELKRRLPVSSSTRTLKEGLIETARLVGADEAAFKRVETVAALIGAQRFVMIWGEPSASDHVARVFDNTRVLLTGLVGAPNSETAPVARLGAVPQSGSEMEDETPGLVAQPKVERDVPLESLKSLLTGNVALTCRLFRALFEHLLGFAAPSSGLQAGASLVSDLTGSKDHSHSFLATALFILGSEVDRDHLMAFMMDQGLFGMPLFEHLLQNRDYCEAFHAFRRLERAFMGSPAAEEALLRNRLDAFNAQYGGKPYGAKIFEGEGQDKAKVDAYLAAADLLEALAITPWCVSLNNAVSAAAPNSIRSVSMIARHFERFGRGEVTKDRTNQEIGDHLLAFARQFSADTKGV